MKNTLATTPFAICLSLSSSELVLSAPKMLEKIKKTEVAPKKYIRPFAVGVKTERKEAWQVSLKEEQKRLNRGALWLFESIMFAGVNLGKKGEVLEMSK